MLLSLIHTYIYIYMYVIYVCMYVCVCVCVCMYVCMYIYIPSVCVMSHMFAHPRAHTRTLLLYAYTHVYMQRTPTHTTHTRKAFRRPKPALARHSLPFAYLQYPTALLSILFSFLLMFPPAFSSCTDVHYTSSLLCINQLYSIFVN